MIEVVIFSWGFAFVVISLILIKIELFTVGYQIYLIPTIKFTHSKTLNGYRAIEFIWLKWGVELKLRKQK